MSPRDERPHLYHIEPGPARYNRLVIRSSGALSALILVAVMAMDASAQRVDDRASELMGELESAPLPHVAPPAVSFVVRGEVAVTGPLEAGPFLEDLAVSVRAAGGIVR